MQIELLATFYGAGGNTCAELSFYESCMHPYHVHYYENNDLVTIKFFDDEETAANECVQFTK